MISNANLYIVDSERKVQDIERDLPRVASQYQYGILGVHDLRQKMNEKGVAFGNECLVFSVCNPKQAKEILDADMGISTLLPCRISVYREGGKTKIATVRPMALLSLLGKSNRAVAEEVERALCKIMEEVAVVPETAAPKR